MGFVILKRILVGIPTLIGVTIILFLTLRVLPGDPVAVLLAGAPSTPEVVAQLREEFGLDKPVWAQYWDFFVKAIQLDFGTSYQTRQPVSTMIGQQIMPTLQLAVAAAAVSAFVGILLGSIAAMYRNTWVDSVIRVVSLINLSAPSFWVGLMLIILFSFTFNIFPATGNAGFKSLVLPAVTLGLSAAGTVTRLVRNSVLEVLGENFVTSLYSRGLSKGVVIMRHVLRNAIIPTVTIVGLQLGALIAGAVIVETVFARQGIGRMLINAIGNQDFPVVQGVVLVIAVIYITINIIVDVSYAYIDPRVRDAVKS